MADDGREGRKRKKERKEDRQICIHGGGSHSLIVELSSMKEEGSTHSSSGGIVNIVFHLPESISVAPIHISVSDPAPIDLNQIHPSAATSNTSFEYSGRHDQGLLPELKSEGPLANMISAILAAKQQSDAILTQLIEESLTAGGNAAGKVKASTEIDELEEGALGREKRKKVRKGYTENSSL